MHSENKQTRLKRASRAKRIRHSIRLPQKLRVSVFRSSKHIQAQIIDDTEGKTVAAAGTYQKEFASEKNKKAVAKLVGLKLAKIAKEKNIKEVVFDRGRYKFFGRVAALAEGAREGGLAF